jgi:preprotein translocase subunit SecG
MDHPWANVVTVIWALTGVFLVLLILVQRGRGSGLAGAFGNAGGQSAFGTKAGDVFTRITIGTAVVWVALAAISGIVMQNAIADRFGGG